MNDPWRNNPRHPGYRPEPNSSAHEDEEDTPEAYGNPPMLPEPSGRVPVFVMGLLSVVLGFVGLILGPIALIMSRTGRREIREGRARRDGLMTAGFVLGIVGTCFGAFMALYLVFMFAFFTTMMPNFENIEYEADVSRAATEVGKLRQLVLSFEAREDRLPASLREAGDGIGERLDDVDPWNRLYVYTVKDEKNFEIRSQGRNISDPSDDIYYDRERDKIVSPEKKPKFG